MIRMMNRKQFICLLLGFSLIFNITFSGNTVAGAASGTISADTAYDTSAAGMAGAAGSLPAAEEGIPAGISPVPVDFSISGSDLLCRETSSSNNGYVRAGKQLTLQVKIHKASGTAAGGTVVFSLLGAIADRVPFYMNASDQYVIVKTYYILPLGSGISTAAAGSGSSNFEAVIETDAICYDTNESNNSASMSTFGTGTSITANDPTAPDAAITSIVTADASGTAVTYAVPGAPLILKANIQGTGGKTRVLFYVNDQLQTNNQCSISSSVGSALSSLTYYVPWASSGYLQIKVVLENGAESTITVPVAAYDFVMKDPCLSWSYVNAGSTAAGNKVSISGKILKDSNITFGHTADRLRVVFIVNGVASGPVEVESSSTYGPNMAEANYMYTIPADCQWPLDIKLLADPGGLFDETNEEDNTSSALIPATPSGSSGANLSISADNLWYFPRAIIPGKKVQLFAAVRNNSSANASSMKVYFDVNGVQIDPGNALYLGVIGGGQYYIFHETWTVPEDMAGSMNFTVTVVPSASAAGDDASDNGASTLLQMAPPDLELSFVYAAGEGGKFYPGTQIELSATVYNTGYLPAAGAVVDFFAGGAAAGSKPAVVPARSSVIVSIPYIIPPASAGTSEDPGILGFTGTVYPSAPDSGVLLLYAQADPGNLIAESNEANNTCKETALYLDTPSGSTGEVYVRVVEGISEEDYEALGQVPVSITAGGKTASAVTDSYGYCSFHNVPYGDYEVTAVKTGYNTAKSYDESFDSSDYAGGTILFMDNKSRVTGFVTDAAGNALVNTTVEVDGQGIKIKTRSDGGYSISLPEGTYTLKFRRVGYARIDETVILPASSSIQRNLVMSPTSMTYIYGCIYDQEGEPMPGMKVEAFQANGTVLAVTYTGADGYYSMGVFLHAEYVEDVGVRVTGQGLYKMQGLFLYRGIEQRCDLSFKPDTGANGDVLSSVEGKVTPWTECASMPGTFYNSSYEVTAIYGMFELDTYIMATDSVITYLDIDITPDFWLYGGVESSWSPLKVLKVGKISGAVIDVACFILPLNIPLAFTFHSTTETKVWIKKVSVVSDGVEVFEKYPDTSGDYAYVPNKAVNWENCRIKYYLKVGPANGAANPAAGYHYDQVLIEWDPNLSEFTKIGNYSVVGWDGKYGHQIFADQG